MESMFDGGLTRLESSTHEVNPTMEVSTNIATHSDLFCLDVQESVAFLKSINVTGEESFKKLRRFEVRFDGTSDDWFLDTVRKIW